MHKPTESRIKIFIDKLDKSGIGISSMPNNDVCLVPYALPGEIVSINSKGQVMINNKLIPEPYVNYECTSSFFNKSPALSLLTEVKASADNPKAPSPSRSA